MLPARDELAAWLGSFDRYAHGAADLQFWIEVWGAQVSLDRVGEGNITVANPAVPLTGTIQPRTLKKKLGQIHFQSGFASRLMLCRPPTTAKTWTEADAEDVARRTLFKWLKDLQKDGLLTKVRRGQYEKTEAAP